MVEHLALHLASLPRTYLISSLLSIRILHLVQTMDSATGIPESRNQDDGRGEDEPLLGRVGDASQQEDQGLQFNFVIGKHFIQATRSE